MREEDLKATVLRAISVTRQDVAMAKGLVIIKLTKGVAPMSSRDHPSILTIVKRMLHSTTGWLGARREAVVRQAFDERRATQMAARYLSKRGGRMPEIVLVKYMYMTEHEALRKWGFPLVWDKLFSLPAGPIQSCVLNLARGKVRTCDGSGYWRDHIVTEYVQGREKEVPVCVLKNATDDDSLPEDVSDLIDEIWDEYKKTNIVDAVHALPEFREPPAGSRRPITYVDILRAVKRGEDVDERARELLCIEHVHASLPE